MNLKDRPLAVCGFTLLLSLIAAIHIDNRLPVAAAGFGFFLLILSVSVKSVREKVFPFFISAGLLLSGFLYLSFNDFKLDPMLRYVGKDAYIEGVLLEDPAFENSRYSYIIEGRKINSHECKTKIKFSLEKALDAEPYDTVKFKGHIYKPGSGNEDIELYYQSKGIMLGAFVYNNPDCRILVEKNEDKPFNYHFISLRESIQNEIFKYLPNEYGGTVIAMLLGNKQFISDNLQTRFRETGIAPVFAVSGLHLSVWIMGLYSLLNMLGVKRKINSAVGIVFTMLFMALTAFSPSVCRAGIMQIFLLSGNLFRRRSDSLNSLGISALLLCCINPMIAADIGFLLSVSATLGIISVVPCVSIYLNEHIHGGFIFKAVKAAITVITVSLCAAVGAIPVTVFFIKYISLVSVLTNVLITYPATLCMIFGGLTAIFSFAKPISAVFAFISGSFAKYIIFVVNKIYELGEITISTSDIYWSAGVIFSLAVLVFAIIFFKGKQLVCVLSVGMSAVIAITSVLSYFHYQGLTEVSVLDVEDGIAVTMSHEDNKVVLCNNSDFYFVYETVRDKLNEIDRSKPDTLFIADADTAENKYVLSMVRDFDFNKIVSPYISGSLKTVTDKEQILKSAQFDMEIYNNGKISYRNFDNVSFAYLDFEGITFLILFSSEKYAEIPEDFIKADFLVCDGFIPFCINPGNFTTVIISAGKNKSETITEYVKSKGGNSVSTADYSDITVSIKNGEYKIISEE